ncbi:hypothetical protein [Ammoniphilus sp. YIM 78166]|nr:hypothetical protein [Ammoniphilus sp. YIM 78166]
MIRETGKFIGQAAGFVLGKPIKYLGEKTGVDLIKGIGDGSY